MEQLGTVGKWCHEKDIVKALSLPHTCMNAEVFASRVGIEQ
jgi:hypothetical protein